MNKKRKVLVIGHDASLSGAPILLLNLFRLLIEREVVDVQFVIRRGGPLVEAYKEVAPVIVLKQSKFGEEKNFLLLIAHWIGNKIKLARVLMKAFSCDYIFFNTVVNGRLMRWFRFHHKPVITYVHELENVINLYLKSKDAVLPLFSSNIIAYPSLTTKDLLICKYKIPAAKLKELSYYFPFSQNDYDAGRASDMRKAFRQKLGIDENDFLVGAVGTISQRKGIDLFMEVGEKIKLSNSAIKLVWVGSFESSQQESDIRNLIKQKRLESNLFFTGSLPYDIYNFSAFDIFFLASREDTYPLVVLEAAIMKVPSICFSGSGGIIEFIGNDAGWIAGDFSAEKVAAKIIELQTVRNVVALRGNRAFEKVISLHCNADRVINQFGNVAADI